MIGTDRGSITWNLVNVNDRLYAHVLDPVSEHIQPGLGCIAEQVRMVLMLTNWHYLFHTKRQLRRELFDLRGKGFEHRNSTSFEGELLREQVQKVQRIVLDD